MDEFRGETQAVVRRFVAREISRSECDGALEVGLTQLIPGFVPEQTATLCAVIKANTEAVIDEVEKRAGKNGGCLGGR